MDCRGTGANCGATVTVEPVQTVMKTREGEWGQLAWSQLPREPGP